MNGKISVMEYRRIYHRMMEEIIDDIRKNYVLDHVQVLCSDGDVCVENVMGFRLMNFDECLLYIKRAERLRFIRHEIGASVVCFGRDGLYKTIIF